MKTNTKVMLIVCAGVLFGCGQSSIPPDFGWDEYEVSPGRFLSVHERWREGRRTERTDIILDWNGQRVRWGASAITFSLRESNGVLYMITLDRSNHKRIRFRYYVLRRGSFHEIRPDQYPKELAVQNIGFRGNRYAKVGAPVKIVDKVKLAVDLDPDAFLFEDSETAKIWYNLVTGKQYYQMPSEIDREFLREYVAKYKPIRLTVILREEDGDDRPKNGGSVPGQGKVSGSGAEKEAENDAGDGGERSE